MTLFGVVGYVMRKRYFPLAPLFSGLTLGPVEKKVADDAESPGTPWRSV